MPGLDRSAHRLVAVGDGEAKERRRVGPVRARVEQHDPRVTDLRLGVADGAVLTPHTDDLDRVERLREEAEYRRGVTVV